MSISDATKQIVRARAEYLCEYYYSPERLRANRFTVDHVIPCSLEPKFRTKQRIIQMDSLILDHLNEKTPFQQVDTLKK
jgi:hypothetical protein